MLISNDRVLMEMYGRASLSALVAWLSTLYACWQVFVIVRMCIANPSAVMEPATWTPLIAPAVILIAVFAWASWTGNRRMLLQANIYSQWGGRLGCMNLPDPTINEPFFYRQLDRTISIGWSGLWTIRRISVTGSGAAVSVGEQIEFLQWLDGQAPKGRRFWSDFSGVRRGITNGIMVRDTDPRLKSMDDRINALRVLASVDERVLYGTQSPQVTTEGDSVNHVKWTGLQSTLPSRYAITCLQTAMEQFYGGEWSVRGIPGGGLDAVMTRAVMNQDGSPAVPDYDAHGTGDDRFSPDGMMYVNAE